MSGAVRRVAVVLALTIIAVGLSTSTSSAESMRWRDWDAFGRPAPAWNIKFGSVANRAEALKFRVRVERVRRGKTKVNVRAKMLTEPDWHVDAVARWPKDGDPRHRLFVWKDKSEREPLRCPAMTSRWETGHHGQVMIRIPHSCTDGPRAWHNFRFATLATLVDEYGVDYRDRLPMGDILQPGL
jgi:hypothetical protein